MRLLLMTRRPATWSAGLCGALMLIWGMVGCGQVAPDQQASNATTGWHAYRLAGVASGFRLAIYNAQRNAIWIVTRTAVQLDNPLIQLSRLNLTDDSTSIAMQFPGTGLTSGGLAVDGRGRVWFGWGRTLAMYDPASVTGKTWALPAISPVLVRASSRPQDDGQVVALLADENGEVWVAARSTLALFGFNPTLGAWDHTLTISVLPYEATPLLESGPGTFAIGGSSGQQPAVLELVDRSTTITRDLPADVRAGFAMVDSNDAVFLDHNWDFQELNLSTGQTHRLATGGTGLVGGVALAADALGNVWFQLAAQAGAPVGLGRLNVGSGAITSYPLPEVASIPVPGAVPPHCGGGPCPFPSASPAPGFGDPQIQAILVDARNDPWLIDRLGDNGDPDPPSKVSPIYQLVP